MNCDFIYKILLLGDSSVGKTCFLLRYIDDTFTENHMSTIGVDYKLKIMSHENKIIKMQIWDTAGQDKFRSITKNYYRGSNGILLVYDVTNETTFNNIKNWIVQIKDYLGDQACITLVGNKIDLEHLRKVSTDEGKKLAEEFDLNFFETSVKNNVSVNEAFESLSNEIIKRNLIDKKVETIDLNIKNKFKNKCCQK